MTKIVAIGDIHGCYDELMELMQLVNEYIETKVHPDETKKIVFLGDYVDRGPKSKKVLEYVHALETHNNFESVDKVIALKGNHEDMAVDTMKEYGIQKMLYQVTGSSTECWLSNGGTQTLQSFNTFDLNNAIERMAYEYRVWLEDLPHMYETNKFYFVHAGMMPWIKPEEQNQEHLLWIRDEFLESPYDFGKVVVHGHTPIGLEIKANRINVDTACCFGGKLTAVILDDETGDLVEVLSVKSFQPNLLI